MKLQDILRVDRAGEPPSDARRIKLRESQPAVD
jgi:hypothetical protein